VAKNEHTAQRAPSGVSMAEGVGFEPTEACTSHAFEACPFGRSGTLPGRQVSGSGDTCHRHYQSSEFTDGENLKKWCGRAETSIVHADLFAAEGGFTPRPAWQVIEAARRQVLTGELTLATTPATHVYLRDGQIYFAERSTDGGLGVRLLVEGVITRQQIGKGALLVSGVEHLGRMFQRDTTIDRQAVELCVELMTDDVLTAVANELIDHYVMNMYKRHASGIDRWLPTRVEIITHIVDGAHLAEPGSEAAQGPAPTPRRDALAAAVAPVAAAVPVVAPAVQPTVPTVQAPPAAAAPAAATAPTAVPVPGAPKVSFGAWEPITAEQLLGPTNGHTNGPNGHTNGTNGHTNGHNNGYVNGTNGHTNGAANGHTVERPVPVPEPAREPSLGSSLAAAAAAGLLDGAAPLTAETIISAAPANDSGISLAQSAVDAIMSTAIADEVAEAVRRALAAIDAAVQPAPSLSPSDFQLGDNAPLDRGPATTNA
jgi:hypothetical protein